MLVIKIFPLGPDTLLKKVIVCLEAKFGSRCDVVLIRKRNSLATYNSIFKNGM